MIVFGADQQIAQWIAGQLGFYGFAGNFLNAIGNVENGKILGGVAFHNHYPKEGVLEMTAASCDPRWLTRKMIRTTFTYAFDLVGVQLTIWRVGEFNERMIDIAKRLGFTGFFIPRLRGMNEGEWLFTLTNDDWLKSPYRKKANG